MIWYVLAIFNACLLFGFGIGYIMTQFKWNIQNDPELAQTILGNDLNKIQEILRLRHRQRSQLQRQKEEELVSLLYDDHFFSSYGKRLNCIITSRFIRIPCAFSLFCYIFLINLFEFFSRLFFTQILLMLKHKRRLKLPSAR